MTELRIQTLGGFRLVQDGRDAPTLDRQPVRAALLVYLALEREARRDALVNLLWPEGNEKDGRHNLNQTIYGLRQLLGDTWAEREGDLVRIGGGITTDALDLEAAVAAGDWARAIELYHGPFLDSTTFSDSAPFQEWSEGVRARMVRLARSAWRGAFESPAIISNVEEGIRLARAWVHHDPLEDEAQHTLLEQLARAGRRAEVLDAYDRYARLLEDELELEPLDHTKALVEAVRAGDGPGVSVVPTGQAAVGVREAWDPTAPAEWSTTSSPTSPAPATPPAATSRSGRRVLPLVAAVVGTLAVMLVIAAVLARGFGRRELLAFDLNPPPGMVPTQTMVDVSLSPDGSEALVSGTDTSGTLRLWVRSIRTSDVRLIPGTERAHTPFWSPDGRRIGYFAKGEIWISSPRGDRPQPIGPTTFETRGASWGSRDVILYAPSSRGGLMAFSIRDGTTRQVTTPDAARGEIGHTWPSFLPDGERFVYLATSDRAEVQGIYLASLSDPAGVLLTTASGNAFYRAGHLLFYRDLTVYAQQFDPRAGRLQGMPEPLVSGVAASFSYQAAFSASEGNDVFIYSADSLRTHSRLRTLDEDGTSLGYDTPRQHQRNPAISPNGRFVAVELYRGPDSDIVVFDRATGGRRTLDDGGGQVYYPTWDPSGDRIAYSAMVPGGWALRVWDLRSSAPPREIRVFDTEVFLAQWIDKGLVFHEDRPDGPSQILLMDPDGADAEPTLLLSGTHFIIQSAVSPSGRFIAYSANDAGDFNVFVSRFPPTGLRCQISTTSGAEPQWGKDDRSLSFIDMAGNLDRVSVDPDNGCAAGLPVLVAPRVVQTPLVAKNHYVVDRNTGAFIVNEYEGPGRYSVSALINWPLALPSVQH